MGRVVWMGLVFGFFAMADAGAATRFVDLNNPTPSAPYTSWSTAAMNIQDAVDVAVSNDTVLVTDGHYYLSSKILVHPNSLDNVSYID